MQEPTGVKHTLKIVRKMNNDNLPKNKDNLLWQTISKENIEEMTDEKITDEEWDEFIEKKQDWFANFVSQLARETWEAWNG